MPLKKKKETTKQAAICRGKINRIRVCGFRGGAAVLHTFFRSAFLEFIYGTF